MKRALVTGGTGFLGKHLVDRLIENGYLVRSFDFRPPLDANSKVEYITGDIRDYNKVRSAVKNCDILFHLASIPSIARAKYNDYFEINVGGTENVLKSAKENEIDKLVHISSSTVYGIPSKCPLTEEDVVENVGYYGKSKIEAEKICWNYSSEKLSVAIIRPRVIMGAGRIGIFSILFDAVLNNKTVYIIGDGKNIFQFTSITDMVDSILLTISCRQTSVFNIGAKDKTIVYDVIKGLIEYSGSKSKIKKTPVWMAKTALKTASFLHISPLINEQFMIADKDFMLDISKAENELGWQPKQSNLDCLIEAFDWYKNNKKDIEKQYTKIFGFLGKYKHSRQGGFQEN